MSISPKTAANGNRPLTRRAYSPKSVATEIDVSRTTVFNLIREGKLKAVKLGHRTLIMADELERFVNQLEAA
ncbi:helix-turn-helix domain-containing protein [Parasphingorhabdus flavimaris]|uniref:helix-turn-helix domain-containing protein n=1 Tax=Parasphingorhabdus flavimaris TaxID=266812 RepID=UPI003AB9B549